MAPTTRTEPVQSDVLNAEIDRLTELLGRRELRILETGCIRCAEEPHRVGDGWSTLTFATHVKANGGQATSVDLDTSAAATVLFREGLAGFHVTLVQADSLAFLDSLVAADAQFDLILLDSASDPRHILREWKRAVKLIASPGVILIDDVAHDATTCGTKGSLLIERLHRDGASFRGLRRWSGYAWIGMIAIDNPNGDSMHASVNAQAQDWLLTRLTAELPGTVLEVGANGVDELLKTHAPDTKAKLLQARPRGRRLPTADVVVLSGLSPAETRQTWYSARQAARKTLLAVVELDREFGNDAVHALGGVVASTNWRTGTLEDGRRVGCYAVAPAS